MKYSKSFLLLSIVICINGCRRFKEELKQFSPCLEAALCVHDGRRKCGFQKSNNEVKWFLDQCDIMEFNCENNASFNRVSSSACLQVPPL
ncbi:uncharacterized protein LOC123714111 isoform X2 [Pieris brassicae]|uniref:uncharacterized protein LOC123714111 isoform X2 n=1 Tax=Pieris brassicae TaxID=7116 RepID=UPI001E65E9D1|nr:uncharacterized protein LOC123714111 isoform X2 [Pieris brassicae]